MTAYEPTTAEARQLHLAISDPGAFVKRGDNYDEPIPDWQTRAVVAAGWRPSGQLPCTCDYAGLAGEAHKPWCEREHGPHAECASRVAHLETELATRAPALDIDAVLASIGRDYVQAINAILAGECVQDPDADTRADVHRWRGHAEARRAVLVYLSRLAGREPAAYTSSEWRNAQGVYIEEQVAEFRKLTSR
jgi:hypothetical protein